MSLTDATFELRGTKCALRLTGFEIQFSVIGSGLSVSTVQKIINEIHLRLQVTYHRRLTHADLASMAETSERSIGEWVRGGIAPAAMQSLLHLLTLLPPEQALEVLAMWRSTDEEVKKPVRVAKRKATSL